MSIFQVAATVEGLAPLKDGGMSVRLHTQEMTDEQKLQALSFFQKYGWMLFKASEMPFSEAEVPKDDPEADEGKSPAQRLRGVMYIYHKEVLKEPDEKFNEWYRKVMEKAINNYKNKLP